VWFEPVFKLVKEVMFRRAKLRFLICDVAAVDVWMDGGVEGRDPR
jgi:hypothetical protein